MTSELNELVKNLSGNNGEQILETLSTLEALVSSASIQNLKNDVAELKEVAHIFGSQLTHNLQQVQQINQDGLANFDNANNALAHNVSALNSISSGLTNSLLEQLNSPETHDAISFKLSQNVGEAVNSLSVRFKQTLEKEAVLEHMQQTVVTAIKAEAEQLAEALKNDPSAAPETLVNALDILRKTARTKDETIKNLMREKEENAATATKFRDMFNGLVEKTEAEQSNGNFFYKFTVLAGVIFVVGHTIFTNYF